MSRRETNQTFKPTKSSQFKRWSSRFSAGGANRTSVHDQIRRLSERDESPERYPSSYHPPPSRLPFDRYGYRREAEYDTGPGEYSPSNFRDGRGRPMQKMGLFRNAKHSDIVMPNVDEQHIRNTEATIRRLTRPEKHSSIYETAGANTVRDRVRQVVCEMGVPDGYRVYDGVAEVRRPEPFGHTQSRRRLFSPTVKRYSNPRQNVLYDSGYEPRTSEKTRNYHDREGPSNSSHKSYRRTNNDYVDDYYYETEEDRRREYDYNRNSRRRSSNYEDRSPEYSPVPRWNNPEIVSTTRKRSKRKNSSDVEMRRRRRGSSSSSDDEKSEKEDDSPPMKEKERNKKAPPSKASTPKENSFTAFQSPVFVKKNDSREARPQSRSSDITVSSRRKMPQYKRDDDNERDSWRQAISLLNDRNGDGAAIVERIGSSMPNLPLTDNSEKCYSTVAFLLIGRSMKNTLQIERDKQKESQKSILTKGKAANKVFNKLQNMSISWAAGSTILAGGGEFPQKYSYHGDDISHNNNDNNNRKDFASGSILNDISKIRNPQMMLANGFDMNESIFANSRFFESEKTKVERKKSSEVQANKYARPVFHSSPVSKDVARSDDMFTMPSSIRNSKSAKNIQMYEDSESNYEFENEMRDYIDIEKGASQLTYVHTPEIPPSQSAFNFDISTINDSPDSIVEETADPNISVRFFKQNVENVEDEEVEDYLNSPLMEDNADPFNFTISNHEPLEPLMDIDATTRRIFDNAYHEHQEREKFKKKKKKSSADPSFLF